MAGTAQARHQIGIEAAFQFQRDAVFAPGLAQQPARRGDGLLQGLAEILRCVVCLRTGMWPSRLKDVAEIDVVGEQLAHSEYVDEDSRQLAIAKAAEIDETARQRGMGGDNKI